MLMRLISGNVRYRFRSDDFDVNIVIEGEANWVQKHVEELGLTGVGWTMPIGTEVKATNLSNTTREIPSYFVNARI